MRQNKFNTSHDLADMLEDAARALRNMPSVEFEWGMTPSKRSKEKGVARTQQRTEIELKTLAAEIQGSDRSIAEKRLSDLTVREIRQIADTLGVRTPSKAPKGDYVRTVLTHVFDVPAGQNVVRTFHERNRADSTAVGTRKPGPNKPEVVS